MVDADYELLSGRRAAAGAARPGALRSHVVVAEPLGVADQAQPGAGARDRHHRPGRLVPGRAAARAGLRGHRAGPARQRASGSAAPSICAAGSSWSTATCSIPRRSPPRWSRSGPTSSTTSRRRRSCPTPGSDPARTLAAIAGATATLLEAVRDRSPHTRVFVARLERDVRRRPREPAARGHPVPAGDAVRDREARRAPARRPAPRPRRHLRLLGDPLQPRVRAPARVRSSRARSRARRPRSSSGSPTRWSSAT